MVSGSSREALTPDEVIALRHVVHHLGHYDCYFVLPKGSPLEFPGLRRMELSRRFFGSVAAHNRMLLTRSFYERFSDYEFILLCHTDALVLGDELEQWCAAGYDYIGAPHFNYAPRNVELDMVYARTGHGGFSLRRVATALAVLRSKKPQVSPREHWRRHYQGKPAAKQVLGLAVCALKVLRPFNGVRWETRRYPGYEDMFWSERAARYAPVNVAPARVAVRFAFDRAPKFCLEQTNGRPPFGVHGWARRDRELWEPHLLRQPVLTRV